MGTQGGPGGCRSSWGHPQGSDQGEKGFGIPEELSSAFPKSWTNKRQQEQLLEGAGMRPSSCSSTNTVTAQPQLPKTCAFLSPSWLWCPDPSGDVGDTKLELWFGVNPPRVRQAPAQHSWAVADDPPTPGVSFLCPSPSPVPLAPRRGIWWQERDGNIHFPTFHAGTSLIFFFSCR